MAIKRFKGKAKEYRGKLDAIPDPSLGEACRAEAHIRHALVHVISDVIGACVHDDDDPTTWEVMGKANLETDGDPGGFSCVRSSLMRVDDATRWPRGRAPLIWRKDHRPTQERLGRALPPLFFVVV